MLADSNAKKSQSFIEGEDTVQKKRSPGKSQSTLDDEESICGAKEIKSGKGKSLLDDENQVCGAEEIKYREGIIDDYEQFAC